MQHLFLFCLLLIPHCQAQVTNEPVTPEWNGDPKLCTTDSQPSPSQEPQVRFPTVAEFTVEFVQSNHLLNFTLPSLLSMYEYFYDYNNNQLVIINNTAGSISRQYFYYKDLKIATYDSDETCTVTDLPQNIDNNGNSAVQLSDNTWHVRSFNEFILFSSNNNQAPKPQYKGKSTVRGIAVDIWETCVVDKTQRRTVFRQWALAQKNIIMPLGPITTVDYPIQGIFRASIQFNGTDLIEADEYFNVLSFRPFILEPTEFFSPPRGVFCGGLSGDQSQNLVSLSDVGITWPREFSVRIDATTARTFRPEVFHLRVDYNNTGSTKRIRYDYLPSGGADYETVIHEYQEDLTYIMDRRLGRCRVRSGTTPRDPNPVLNPIQFFIKNEALFITNPPTKQWQYNGLRRCRGGTSRCIIMTTTKLQFPPIVDQETGAPTGEQWSWANIEYAWSTRTPLQTPAPGEQQTFDYPVHLFLRLYRQNPSDGFIFTEEIEYSFFEMSTDISSREFSLSHCYRALNASYIHLGFKFDLIQGSMAHSRTFNRRRIEGEIRRAIAASMEIDRLRIDDMELDYFSGTTIHPTIFTLLGPSLAPTGSLKLNDGVTAETAKDRLQRAIDRGDFIVEVQGVNASITPLKFKAIVGSLATSKQFMTDYNADAPQYSSGAIAGGVVGGLIVGLLVGAIIVVIARYIRKEPLPSMPGGLSSFSIPNVNFRKSATTGTTINTGSKDTSTA